MKLQRQVALSKFVLLVVFAMSPPAMSQAGYVLWGDVKIDDSKASSPGPSSVTIVLYDRSTKIVGRLTVGNRGRYRFSNLRGGEYDISVEANGSEIARVRPARQNRILHLFKRHRTEPTCVTSSNEFCNCRKDTLPSSPICSAGNTASRSRWKPLP